MNTATLLEEMKERGIQLTVAPDGIRYKAKPGTMTPELREAIREHKAQIAAELQSCAISRQRWGMPPHEEFPLAEHAPRLSEEEIRLIAGAIERQPPDVMRWALEQADHYEDVHGWPHAVCDIAGALDALLWQHERNLVGQSHQERVRNLLDMLRVIEDFSDLTKRGRF